MSPILDTGFTFQSQASFELIRNKGLSLLKKGMVAKEAIDFGSQYYNQLRKDTDLIEVKAVDEVVGKGAFAKRDVAENAFIGHYSGCVRENSRIYFVPLNDYLYEYPIKDELDRSYVIDAHEGNLCRFINHSERPNLKPHYAFYDGLFYVIFLSLRKIVRGEQFLYDYGKNYWLLRSKPKAI